MIIYKSKLVVKNLLLFIFLGNITISSGQEIPAPEPIIEKIDENDLFIPANIKKINHKGIREKVLKDIYIYELTQRASKEPKMGLVLLQLNHDIKNNQKITPKKINDYLDIAKTIDSFGVFKDGKITRNQEFVEGIKTLTKKVKLFSGPIVAVTLEISEFLAEDIARIEDQKATVEKKLETINNFSEILNHQPSVNLILENIVELDIAGLEDDKANASLILKTLETYTNITNYKMATLKLYRKQAQGFFQDMSQKEISLGFAHMFSSLVEINKLIDDLNDESITKKEFNISVNNILKKQRENLNEVKKVQKNVKKGNEKFFEFKQQFDKEVKEKKNKQLLVKDYNELLKEEAVLNRNFSTFNSGFSMINTLSGFIKNPETRKDFNTISSVANTSVQIAQRSSKYYYDLQKASEKFSSIANAVDPSSIALSFDIMTMVANVALMFIDTGPSAEQMILEQLAEMFKFLEDFYEMVENRFNQLDFKISAMWADMLKNFGDIKKGQRITTEQMKAVAEKLLVIEKDLHLGYSSVLNYLIEGDKIDFEANHNFCKEFHLSKKTSIRKFQMECLFPWRNQANLFNRGLTRYEQQTWATNRDVSSVWEYGSFLSNQVAIDNNLTYGNISIWSSSMDNYSDLLKKRLQNIPEEKEALINAEKEFIKDSLNKYNVFVENSKESMSTENINKIAQQFTLEYKGAYSNLLQSIGNTHIKESYDQMNLPGLLSVNEQNFSFNKVLSDRSPLIGLESSELVKRIYSLYTKNFDKLTTLVEKGHKGSLDSEETLFLEQMLPKDSFIFAAGKFYKMPMHDVLDKSVFGPNGKANSYKNYTMNFHPKILKDINPIFIVAAKLGLVKLKFNYQAQRLWDIIYETKSSHYIGGSKDNGTNLRVLVTMHLNIDPKNQTTFFEDKFLDSDLDDEQKQILKSDFLPAEAIVAAYDFIYRFYQKHGDDVRHWHAILPTWNTGKYSEQLVVAEEIKIKYEIKKFLRNIVYKGDPRTHFKYYYEQDDFDAVFWKGDLPTSIRDFKPYLRSKEIADLHFKNNEDLSHTKIFRMRPKFQREYFQDFLKIEINKKGQDDMDKFSTLLLDDKKIFDKLKNETSTLIKSRAKLDLLLKYSYSNSIQESDIFGEYLFGERRLLDIDGIYKLVIQALSQGYTWPEVFIMVGTRSNDLMNYVSGEVPDKLINNGNFEVPLFAKETSQRLNDLLNFIQPE